MDKHEGKPQPIISCDVCGLRLTTERGLKKHKDNQHPADGKKDHHCPKCPKISPTLKALRKHIRTMHEKGFEYKCNICDRTFKRAEVLREHIASHTGTPLYYCPWCPRTFNSNGNMHAHRKKMHPKEWEESKLKKYELNSITSTNIVNNNVCEKSNLQKYALNYATPAIIPTNITNDNLCEESRLQKYALNYTTPANIPNNNMCEESKLEKCALNTITPTNIVNNNVCEESKLEKYGLNIITPTNESELQKYALNYATPTNIINNDVWEQSKLQKYALNNMTPTNIVDNGISESA